MESKTKRESKRGMERNLERESEAWWGEVGGEHTGLKYVACNRWKHVESKTLLEVLKPA